MGTAYQINKGVTPGDLYRNLVLENVSNAAFQDPSQFIARAIFSTVPSEEEVGKYYEMDMTTVAQDKARVRAPGTAAEEGVWNMTLKSYACEQWGYREKLPEELIATGNAAAAAETASAKAVAEVLLINEEVRFANAFWKTGVWTRDMIGQATADATHYIFWNNSASTPILDIYAEQNKQLLAGKRPGNVLAVGADVLPQLLNHPTVIARVASGQTPGGPAMSQWTAQQQLSTLAMIFGVDRVVVARGVYNTANESATPVGSFILNSKSAWLGYVPPAPSIFTPSAGYRFTWAGLAGNSMGVRNWRYWDQSVRSWYIEGAVNDTFKLVTPQLGTFFSAIVQ